MNLFTKSCKCGGIIIGPREGGKARGEWLGYDECLDCRDNEQPREPAQPNKRAGSNHNGE